MSSSDFPFEQFPAHDYSGRPAARDSYSNISISAVISSSCVILEGLRDNPEGVATKFSSLEDRQVLFSPEFRNSLSPRLFNGDGPSPSSSAEKFTTDSWSGSHAVSGCGDHFFESAATEFTYGEDVAFNTGSEEKCLTENEGDVAMIFRSNCGQTLTEDGAEGELCHADAAFSHPHNMAPNNGYDYYSPDRGISSGFSRCSWYEPSVNHSDFHCDQMNEPSYYFTLFPKTNSAALESNNDASFIRDVGRDEYHLKDSENCWTNDTYGQYQTHSPPDTCITDQPTGCSKGNTGVSYMEFNSLRQRLLTSSQGNEGCVSSSPSSHAETTASCARNTSPGPYSFEGHNNRDCSEVLPNNDFLFSDSCRRESSQVSAAKNTRRNKSEFKGETEGLRLESHNDARKQGSVSPTYKSELNLESKSNSSFVDQNVNSGNEQDKMELLPSFGCLSFHETVKNVDDVSEAAGEESSKVVTGCKIKRKSTETVESLQRHLEMLEDRRNKMPPSCSSLNLLRQRGEDVRDVPENDKGAPSIIDVNHMMCSGVTVAGFKPRAIIR